MSTPRDMPPDRSRFDRRQGFGTGVVDPRIRELTTRLRGARGDGVDRVELDPR